MNHISIRANIKQNVDFKKDFRFSKHWQIINSAYSNISFDPEKRANSIVKEYSQELDEDLKLLGDKTGNYNEKYQQKFLEWINAKAKCISSMITGSSNFPVSRAEKANRLEEKKFAAFRHWRSKYFKSVNRVRTKSPEEDLEIKMRQVDESIILNAKIIAFNKTIRRYKFGKINKNQFFEQVNQSELNDEIKTFIKNDIDQPWFNKLSTLGADIKRKKEMAEAFRKRIERKIQWQDIEFEGGYITIADDRVKIFHHNKPDNDRLTALSANGFRYSRYWNCHCRKHTSNAIIAAQRIINQ